MRAVDLVRQIWGGEPLANAANPANAKAHSQVSQVSQHPGQRIADTHSQHSQDSRPPADCIAGEPFAEFATFATAQPCANDPAPARPLQPRPAVLRIPQRFADPQEEALLLLDWLHALGVTLTAEHDALTAHGLHTLPAELREEVEALLLPEVMGRDLLAAVQARDAAAAAIERAMPLQRCWGCAHLRTFDAHRGHAPQCQRGHALAWRRTGPGGVRTVPWRVSKRGPCRDYQPEGRA